MANSRKSRNQNKQQDIPAAFERALGAIRARVSAYGADNHGSNADQEFAIALAYSGGLDSSVLLWLAVGYARQHQVRIEALHVHHGLSANADDWSAHCVRVCQALGVALHVSRVSVSGEGDGIEAAA
ncbi:ATP-binding protein, partial [Lacisediminimonas sp.]|uniref:ATP-binding protein n=1 Tax=Lacisediminimonas sp. TaxID=3060582 RepID=UPI002723CF3E